MLRYYARLSWMNVKRSPSLYGLVLLTLSVGIGLFIANMAIIQVMNSDPIPHKSDRLFHISLNTWQDDNPWRQPMNISRYADVKAVMDSGIATQVAVTYEGYGYPKVGGSANPLRYKASVRAVSPDFFQMMDAPFASGQGFSASEAEEVVIGHDMKQTLFGNAKAIGKTIDLSGKRYSVVGVLQPWRVRPLFYHVEIGAYRNTSDVFIPLQTAIHNEVAIKGQSSSTDFFKTLEEATTKNVFFLQLWAQLDSEQQKQDLQNFLTNYCRDLKQTGHHPNDILNELHSVPEWLKENKIVNKKVVAFSMASTLFLMVCLFNASSLLLARYNANHFEGGLRRALGASRKQLLAQGVIEAVLLGVCAGILALVLGAVCLYLSGYILPIMSDMTMPDTRMLLFGLLLAIVTTVLCSLYPVIINARSNISIELKG